MTITWPFRKQHPTASVEATAALRGTEQRVAEADERLLQAVVISHSLYETRKTNHFGAAVQAAMRGRAEDED